MLGEFTLTRGATSPGWGWRIARLWGGVWRPGGHGVPPVGPCRVWRVKSQQCCINPGDLTPALCWHGLFLWSFPSLSLTWEGDCSYLGYTQNNMRVVFFLLQIQSRCCSVVRGWTSKLVAETNPGCCLHRMGLMEHMLLPWQCLTPGPWWPKIAGSVTGGWYPWEAEATPQGTLCHTVRNSSGSFSMHFPGFQENCL